MQLHLECHRNKLLPCAAVLSSGRTTTVASESSVTFIFGPGAKRGGSSSELKNHKMQEQ